MSSLFGLLDLGASAIQAQNASVATAGNNTANVNTEGYSRQRVDLRANLGSPVFGGVTFGSPDRMGDELLASRQRLVGGASGFYDNLSSALLNLESVLTSSEADISSGLAELFGNLNNVAASPLDTQVREEALASARRLSSSFRQQVSGVEQAQSDADLRIRANADSASALASEIAKLNTAIQISHDPVLVDQRELAALRLSNLVGGKAVLDNDGQMRYLLDNGAVTVERGKASTFATSSDPALGGLARIDVVDGTHRIDVTAAISAGSMGADLHFRDQITSGIIEEIDQLAFDVATSFNAVHRGFAGLDSVAGRDLFDEPLIVAGAAGAFAVDATVNNDSAALATATIGQGPGDNGGMLALLDLNQQLLAGGGTRTFLDESVNFVAGLGREVRAAVSDQRFNSTQKDILDSLRDSISGVSLEEEMNRLSQFQNASQASMKFVQIVDQLLNEMINTL